MIYAFVVGALGGLFPNILWWEAVLIALLFLSLKEGYSMITGRDYLSDEESHYHTYLGELKNRRAAGSAPPWIAYWIQLLSFGALTSAAGFLVVRLFK